MILETTFFVYDDPIYDLRVMLASGDKQVGVEKCMVRCTYKNQGFIVRICIREKLAVSEIKDVAGL